MNSSPDYARRLRLAVLALLALALLFVTAGCAPVAPSPSPPVSSPSPPPRTATPETDLSEWEEAKRDGPSNMSPYGIGFDEAFPKTSLIKFRTRQVEPGVVITAPFHSLNRSDEAEVHRLFVLLDGEQQRGGIGGDPDALYTDVTVGPGEEITQTVTIPPLEPGAHDLIVISILNPDDSPGLSYSRYTLLAGDSDGQVPRDYVTLTDANPPGITGPMSLFISDDLDNPPKELREWTVTQAATGELVEYIIYAGYEAVIDGDTGKVMGADLHRVAVLAFLDHQQVPVRPGGEMVFYGEAPKGATGRIEAGVRAPICWCF